jgi:hypothetical protein
VSLLACLLPCWVGVQLLLQAHHNNEPDQPCEAADSAAPTLQFASYLHRQLPAR